MPALNLQGEDELMIEYFDDTLRQSKAVKSAAATAAAAYACNHVLGTNYELWLYAKNGKPLNGTTWTGAELVGIPPDDVRLLQSGQFAKKYPKEPLYRKVQAVFDEKLPTYEKSALYEVRRKFEERLKAIAITVVVVGGLLVWGLAGAWHNHQTSVAQHNDVTANNQQDRLTVDNTFSFLLPCTPSSKPLVTDDTDLKSTIVSCSEEDSTGATTYGYQLENEVYKTSRYSPQVEYSNCAAYTSDQGEKFTVIDNHIEDVHGIQFAVCNTAGSSGTVDIIARAVTANTMQYFRLTTDTTHQNNVWLKYRGMLESFEYIQQ